MNNINGIKTMIAKGDKEEAIKLLVSLVRQDGNNVEAWLLLGDAIDDLAKKKDCYNRVLKLSPNNPLALDRLRNLDPQQPRLDLSVSENLEDTQPRIQNKLGFNPSQHYTLGEPVGYSGNQTKPKFVSTKKYAAAQPSKTSFGTCIVLGIIGFCILSLLTQCISSLQNSTSSSAATADPQEQAAIDAVQNQSTILANNMHESIAVVLVLLENDGHTQSIDGWNVSRGDGYYSVKFYFYLDGNREYAEWWYYPDTELIVPKNDWAFTFMGE